MLNEEATWIRQSLDQLVKGESMYPIGNIGSSIVNKVRDESWLPALMDSLRSGGKIYNVDIKDHPSIDFVGDLLDDAFVRKLVEVGFKLVLCCNVFSCIKDRARFAQSLLAITPKESHLLVTVSRKYPFVADPVDTLYRPTPDELAALFPGTVVVAQAVVESHSYFRILADNPRLLSLTAVRALLPFYKPANWFQLVKYFPHMMKPVSASCVLLKKL